jgi:ABC-type phosphate transport system substrate-binding protein
MILSENNMHNAIRAGLLGLTLMCAGAPALAIEIAVVVNPKNPATRMFSEQASQFFLGKSTMFVPLDQAEKSPIRAEFYQKLSGKDISQVKAAWAKIVFTGKGVAPAEMHSTAEVKKAVAADVNAIGYIEKSAVDDSVKTILTIP